MTPKFGLDVFIDKKAGPWRGKKIGLVAHQASVTRHLQPAITVLSQTPGIKLKALFAPEHGLCGALQDQVKVPSSSHTGTQLPVHSLYGDQISPPEKLLNHCDVLVFDLQDIGVRYYTFIWTMALLMQAAARKGLPFVILDRPNPLGGITLEGNLPHPAFSSFVGLFPLPVRHGMTCGELALYFNEKFHFHTDLHVIKMQGWKRHQWHDDSPFPWVMPSPNMPTIDTASVYAGMCLLEATNISEGRGTTRPFEMAGAPFIDSTRLIRALQKKDLPGVAFRPCSFVPAFNKWAGKTCHGVQIHVLNRDKFLSFLTGLVFIQTVKSLWPEKFKWKKPPYEYETKKPPIDILCGTDAVRQSIDKNKDILPLYTQWTDSLNAFKRERAPYLVY